MPHRLDAGGVLATLGGALLLVSLFLDWYPRASAWTVFEIVDIVLAAIAIGAIASALPLRRPGEPASVGLVPGRWLPALAAAALVLVVVSLVNDPPAAIGADHETGAWLALAGALLLAAGAVLARARISIVVSLRPGERRDPAAAETTVRPTEPLRSEDPTRAPREPGL